MSRRRVLIVTPDFPPATGGIQLLVDRIAGCLQSFERTVVTLDHPGAAAVDREREFRILRAGGTSGRHDVAVARLNLVVARTAVDQRPHVILCMHIVVSPVASLLARQLGIPWVLYTYAKELGARPGLARFAVARADRIIAISSYTRNLVLGAGAPAEKIVTIQPGVDVPPDSAVNMRRDRSPTVVTVSRLEDRYKGHDVVMRAFPLVCAKVPHARWRIVGDGPLRPILEDRAAALDLNHVVDFVGRVSDEARDRELDHAAVFCMVSRLPATGYAGEGFGIVYLEANARGLPVIGGAVGGATDAIVDGETGLQVDPEDHVAVADALITLLGDLDMARRLGQAGRMRTQQLTWTSAGRRVEAELEALLA